MMEKLIEKLNERFGKENTKILTHQGLEDDSPYKFIQIDVQKRSPIKILMTCGLSDYRMPVPEKFMGKESNEIFFCLPSYWDLDDVSNPNMNWVFDTLIRLKKYVIEKQSWFGVGHTIPYSNPPKSISEMMKQSYFFFNEPVFLKEELQVIQLGDKTIHFLAIIPIFEDEFDYKLGKGTYKFQKKLNQVNVTELLDDYRSTVLKSKWRLFRK